MAKERRMNKKENMAERKFLRANGTMEEAMMWNILKNKQVANTRFRRQFSVGTYILDFYSPELKLAIELDGANHFSSEGLEHDFIRDKYLSSLGIKVLRFENYTVLKMQPVVIATIENAIKDLKRGCE